MALQHKLPPKSGLADHRTGRSFFKAAFLSNFSVVTYTPRGGTMDILMALNDKRKEYQQQINTIDAAIKLFIGEVGICFSSELLRD